MTRETKVGLVVACSFLCLVGIVVASKWRNGDTTTKEPEQQEIRVTATKEGQPGKPPMVPEKKDEGRPGANVGGTVAPPPLNAINAVVNTDPMIPVLQGAIAPPALPGTLPALPLPPADSGTPNPFASAQPIVPDPKSAPMVPLPVPPVGADVATLPKRSDNSREKKNGGVTPPGRIEIAQGSNSKPVEPLPLVPPIANDPAAKKVGPFPPLPPAANDPALAKKMEPFPPLPPPANDPALAKKMEPLQPLPPAANDPAAKKVEPFPPLPPAAIDPAAKKVEPFPPLPPAAIDPAAKKVEPFPPLPPAANNPAPAVSLQQAGSIPQIPRADAPGLPPIIVKGAMPPLPVVKETMLDFYECRQGENTFTNLSMRFYGTDRYTDALQMYNRANSKMIRGGSNLTIDPPVLNPGQQVLHPPKELLERDFGSSIRVTTIAPPANPGIAPAVKITATTPLQPVPISDPPIAPPAVGATYKVQNPNGESILDIAERLLGNRSRWTTIYDLNRANPAVQPQFRIPVGTELKMPAS